MKIAIDSGPLTSGHKMRGVGVYTRELIVALAQESKKIKGLKITALDFEKTDLNKFDLVNYTYFNPFYATLPFKKTAKTIITIHDVIPLIYPKHYPPGVKGNIKFLLQKYLLKDVDGIIVPSETSKKDVVRYLGVPQEKIKVIHEAPRSIFRKLEIKNWKLEITKRYSLPKRFVLYVGDVNYNKNILALIKACKLAKLTLVICGKQAKEIEQMGMGLDLMRGPMDWFRYLFDIPHPELAHFRELIEIFKSKQKVIRLGYVNDEDLVKIYNLASVYCQPSFYEGFGLPVVEAMACGIPVVCSKTQALVELADEAALFADPMDPKDMTEKIRKILKNEKIKKELVKKGFERAKEFSWKRTAKETIDFYKSINNQ